ncbi:MAG TPA: hypothetical protein VN628_03620 [Vicinamibacterales bacterium]|nr:hypothetical protein [Vicinamibacterales bacterium]
MKFLKIGSLAAALVLTVYAVQPRPVVAAGDTASGNVGLKSAGALAFGPDGVLFVGDSVGGAVAAIETGDKTPAAAGAKVDVQGLDTKLAAMVGVQAGDILINDVAVNPISKNVYVSAARGRGPDAAALVVRVDTAGKLTLLPLDNIKHDTVSLSDVPADNPGARQNPRTQTITDMQFVNGNLMIAGMSNEEWNSALRSIPYPFKTAGKGTQLQIWHASHGRYETQAPIRTFVPYTIDGQQYVLAAYTCTPLVKIPVSDLKAGAQVKGVTISDLGSGNQPLDMVPYKKDGHEFILVANSSFGVVKLHADNMGQYKPIDSPTVVDVAGAPYDKIASVTNVRHLTAFDATRAVVLTSAGGGGFGPATGPFNIQTIALP